MKRKILNSSSRLGQLQCSWWSGLVEEALWVLFLLSVHRNIISYQKTVACTFVQVTAGSQAKIDLAIKLGADKGVIIIIIIINTFTFSSSLLPPTPSSTAVWSCKDLPFILLVRLIPPDQKSVRELNYVSHHCQASSVATKTSIWQKNFPRRYLWEDALKYLGNDPLGPGELSRGGVQGCGQQVDKRHRSQHYSWLHWRQVIDPQSLGKDWDMRGGFLPSDFCSTATALETSPPSRRTGAGLCTDWWGDLRSTRPVGIFVGCWPLLFVLLIGWPWAQCHQSCKLEHNMVVNKISSSTVTVSSPVTPLLCYVVFNPFS